jgi:hypothetical protein
VTAAQWQLAFEALLAWKKEQGIEDERLTLTPDDLGLRLTYLATGTRRCDERPRLRPRRPVRVKR